MQRHAYVPISTRSTRSVSCGAFRSATSAPSVDACYSCRASAAAGNCPTISSTLAAARARQRAKPRAARTAAASLTLEICITRCA